MNVRQELKSSKMSKSISTKPNPMEMLQEIEEFILETNADVLEKKDAVLQKRWLKTLMGRIENMNEYGE